CRAHPTPTASPYTTLFRSDLRIDRADHDADDFARREELAPVVVLLAHFEEQALVDLGESEDVRGVHAVEAKLVDLVEDVAEVLRSEEHTSEVQSPDHVVWR